MNVEELIRSYLHEVNIMQLATSSDDKPWICTVHYFSDDKLNLYWISTPARRHSQEIKQNAKVAAYFLVHENTSTENYIIGLAASGTAELIGENVDEKIGQAYIKKLNKDPNLLKDIQTGKNPHKFYKLTIDKFALFDTKNFPGNPSQEWEPTK